MVAEKNVIPTSKLDTLCFTEVCVVILWGYASRYPTLVFIDRVRIKEKVAKFQHDHDRNRLLMLSTFRTWSALQRAVSKRNSSLKKLVFKVITPWCL